MSGFTAGGEDLERIFFTEYELFDKLVGNALWSWGAATNGTLGDGTITSKSSPVTPTGGGINWAYIACLPFNSGQAAGVAAIKTDGTLWTWGGNPVGQLGDGTTTARSTPGTTAGGGTNWKQVACGYGHTAAIKTDGTLWTWGRDFYGSLGSGGTNSRSSPNTTVGGGTNWEQITAGVDVNGAIKTDGTLWTWGKNNKGQLGDGTTTNRLSPVTTAGGGTNWKTITYGCAGNATACMLAIKTDGTLWGWGNNNVGQLGTGDTSPRSSPVTTAVGGTNWKQVSTNFGSTAAIKTDGTLWTWGANATGQLGDNSTTSRSTPGTTAVGGTTWKQVSIMTKQTAAIKTDGTLWTWGSNAFGELGTGNTTSRSTPGPVVGGSIYNWKQVSCGYQFTLAIGER